MVFTSVPLLTLLKLHPAYQKFANTEPIDKNEFSIRNQLPIRPSSTSTTTVTTNNALHIFDDSFERDDDDEDISEDRELEEIKRKLAPKLAKLVNSQRSAANAVECVSRMSDSAGLLVGPSNHF